MRADRRTVRLPDITEGLVLLQFLRFIYTEQKRMRKRFFFDFVTAQCEH